VAKYALVYLRGSKPESEAGGVKIMEDWQNRVDGGGD